MPSVIFNFLASTAGFMVGAQSVQNQLLSLGSTSTQAAQQTQIAATRMAAGGQALGLLAAPIGAAAAAVIGFGTQAVGTGLSFEFWMRRIQAVSTQSMGASEEEINSNKEALRDLGLTLGKDLPITADEAAQAMYGLATSGFSVQQILGKDNMGRTLAEAVVNLQMASGGILGFDDAAKLVGTTMLSMGLGVEQASRVTDVLTTVVNASAAEMNDLQYTMKYIAPIAGTLGIGFDQLGAAIGVMANQGFRGEVAGVALRNIFSRLAIPRDVGAKALAAIGVSTVDANGKLRPLEELLGTIAARTEGMADVQLFGFAKNVVGEAYAASFLALLNSMRVGARGTGIDFEKMLATVQNSQGAAAESARLQMAGFPGLLREIEGVWESFQVRVSDNLMELLDIVGELIDAVGELALAFVASPFGRVATNLIAIAAALGAAGAGLIGLVAGSRAYMGALIGALNTMAPGLAATQGTVVAFFAVATGLIAAAALVVYAFRIAWQNNWEGIRSTTEAALNGIRSIFDPILKPIVQEFKTLGVTIQNISKAHGLDTVQAAIVAITIRLHQLFGSATGFAFEQIVATLTGGLSGFGSVFTRVINAVFGGIGRVVQEFASLLVMTGNIARNNGMNVVDAALAAITIRIRELFGEDAAGWFQALVNGFVAVYDAAARVLFEFRAFQEMARNIAQTHGLNAVDAALAAIEIRLREVFGDQAANFFHSLVDGARAIVDAFNAAVFEVRNFIATVQNIARDNGLSTLDAAIVAIELRLRELFGVNVGDVFHTFVDSARSVWDTITNVVIPAVQRLIVWLRDNLPTILVSLGGLWETFLGPMVAAIGGVVGALVPIFAAVFAAVAPVAVAIAQTLGPPLQNLFQAVGPILAGILTWATTSGAITMISALVGNLVAGFGGLATAIGVALAEFELIGASVGGFVGFEAIVEGILFLLGGPFTAAMFALAAVVSLFVAAWVGNWFGIRDTLVGVWEGTILPAFAALRQWLDTYLPPVLAAFGQFFQYILIPILRIAAAVIGTVVGEGFRLLGEHLSGLVPILQLVGGLLGGLVVAGFRLLGEKITLIMVDLATAGDRFSAFGSLLQTIAGDIGGAFAKLGTSLKTELDKIGTFFDDLGTKADEAKTKLLEFFGVRVQPTPAPAAVGEGGPGAGPTAAGGGLDTQIQDAKDKIGGYFDWLGTEADSEAGLITRPFGVYLGDLPKTVELALKLAGAEFDTFGANVRRTMDDAGAAIGGFFDGLGTWASKIGPAIGGFFDGLGTDANAGVQGALAGVGAAFDALGTGITNWWTNAIPARIRDALGTLFATIGEAFDLIGQIARIAVDQLGRNIGGIFSGLGTNVRQTLDNFGVDLQTMWDDLKNAAGVAWTAISKAVGDEVAKIADGAGKKLDDANKLLTDGWTKLSEKAGELWGTIQTSGAGKYFSWLGTEAHTEWDTFEAWFKEKNDGLVTITEPGWTNARVNGPGKYFDWLGTEAHSEWDTFSAWYDQASASLAAVVGPRWDELTGLVGRNMSQLGTDAQAVWTGLTTTAGTGFDTLGTNLRGVWDTISTEFGTAWANFSALVATKNAEVAGWANEIGANFLTGIQTGWLNFNNWWNTTQADVDARFMAMIAGWADYGWSLIASFIAGMQAQWDQVVGWLRRLRDHLPASPAQEGPLSEPVSWETYLFGDLGTTIEKIVNAVTGLVGTIWSTLTGEKQTVDLSTALAASLTTSLQPLLDPLTGETGLFARLSAAIEALNTNLALALPGFQALALAFNPQGTGVVPVGPLQAGQQVIVQGPLIQYPIVDNEARLQQLLAETQQTLVDLFEVGLTGAESQDVNTPHGFTREP
jgi:TP901 family phage tail tape measure protein